jgi:hypothetical protein
MLGDEAVVGGLELDERAEHAGWRHGLKSGNEALDRVQPGDRRRPFRGAREPLDFARIVA